jgi:hypothetical protein
MLIMRIDEMCEEERDHQRAQIWQAVYGDRWREVYDYLISSTSYEEWDARKQEVDDGLFLRDDNESAMMRNEMGTGS